MKGWVCEFCYEPCAEERLPDSWAWVWQSAVCPACQERVEADGGYSVVVCGAYAGDRPDPRDREIPEAVAFAERLLGGAS